MKPLLTAIAFILISSLGAQDLIHRSTMPAADVIVLMGNIANVLDQQASENAALARQLPSASDYFNGRADGLSAAAAKVRLQMPIDAETISLPPVISPTSRDDR